MAEPQIPSAATIHENNNAEPEDPADIGYTPRTEFGRLALAAGREFFARHGRFLSMEEIEREVAERRGGTHLLDLDDE